MKLKGKEKTVISRLENDGYQWCQWWPVAKVIIMGKNGKFLTIKKGKVITGYHPLKP